MEPNLYFVAIASLRRLHGGAALLLLMAAGCCQSRTGLEGTIPIGGRVTYQPETSGLMDSVNDEHSRYKEIELVD